jgi:glutamine cyclotransferase
VDGEIFANVWQTNYIARIDPVTGQVKAWIDLSGLPETVGAHDPDNVLNGIAYDSAGHRLFVTGKRWPHLYEIKLKRKGAG